MARTKGNPQRTVKRGNQNQVLLNIFLKTIYRRNILFFSKYNLEIKYQWQALFSEPTIPKNQVPRKSTDESADDAADNNDVDGEDDDCDEVPGGRLHLKNWQTFNLSPAWWLCRCARVLMIVMIGTRRWKNHSFPFK